jgi:BirA family biotin operon repressor/biotin-[acetyl-CoA-carboxylase] ligase
MDEARTWLSEGAPHGALVIADEQTSGRGRLNRAWQTPMGSALAVSVVLRTAPQALSAVSMLGGLAVADMLDGLGVPAVGLKWPNDVLIDKAKVSGVLAEAHWDGIALRGVVLGIGVNVSVDFAGTALAGEAVSVEAVLCRPVDRLAMLVSLIAHLEAGVPLLGSAALFQRWRSRLVTLGQRVHVQGVMPFWGTAEDVDDDGALWVRDDEGLRRRVIAGDVRVRPAPDG